jgi:hypothetical protein
VRQSRIMDTATAIAMLPMRSMTKKLFEEMVPV